MLYQIKEVLNVELLGHIGTWFYMIFYMIFLSLGNPDLMTREWVILFSNYPELITNNYVERLSTFIDYAKSMLQTAEPLIMSDIFDTHFFDNFDSAKKQVVINKLFEAMFVSVTHMHACGNTCMHACGNYGTNLIFR